MRAASVRRTLGGSPINPVLVLIAVLAVGWFVGMGAIAGRYAARRRRSAPTWFVLGGVIGPVAIVILRTAPPGTCGVCLSPVAGWSFRCQYCGGDVRSSPAIVERPVASATGRPATPAEPDARRETTAGADGRTTRRQRTPMARKMTGPGRAASATAQRRRAARTSTEADAVAAWDSVSTAANEEAETAATPEATEIAEVAAEPEAAGIPETAEIAEAAATPETAEIAEVAAEPETAEIAETAEAIEATEIAEVAATDEAAEIAEESATPEAMDAIEVAEVAEAAATAEPETAEIAEVAATPEAMDAIEVAETAEAAAMHEAAEVAEAAATDEVAEIAEAAEVAETAAMPEAMDEAAEVAETAAMPEAMDEAAEVAAAAATDEVAAEPETAEIAEAAATDDAAEIAEVAEGTAVPSGSPAAGEPGQAPAAATGASPFGARPATSMGARPPASMAARSAGAAAVPSSTNGTRAASGSSAAAGAPASGPQLTPLAAAVFVEGSAVLRPGMWYQLMTAGDRLLIADRPESLPSHPDVSRPLSEVTITTLNDLLLITGVGADPGAFYLVFTSVRDRSPRGLTAELEAIRAGAHPPATSG